MVLLFFPSFFLQQEVKLLTGNIATSTDPLEVLNAAEDGTQKHKNKVLLYAGQV